MKASQVSLSLSLKIKNIEPGEGPWRAPREPPWPKPFRISFRRRFISLFLSSSLSLYLSLILNEAIASIWLDRANGEPSSLITRRFCFFVATVDLEAEESFLFVACSLFFKFRSRSFSLSLSLSLLHRPGKRLWPWFPAGPGGQRKCFFSSPWLSTVSTKKSKQKSHLRERGRERRRDETGCFAQVKKSS